MRKSRFLTLFLTVVFILANVSIPSFAALQYGLPEIDGASYSITAPIAGKAFRVSIVENGEGDEYSHGRNNPFPYFTRNGGLLTLPAHEELTIKTGGTLLYSPNYSATTNGTKYISFPKVFGSFNYTFDDGVLPSDQGQWSQGTTFDATKCLITGLTHVENGDDDYATATASSQIRTRGMFLKGQGNAAPFMLEMELKDFRNDILPFLDVVDDGNNAGRIVTRINETWVNGLSGATKGNFDFANFDIHDGEWHKLKWVITPDAYTVGENTIPQHFDLYIDDMLVVADAPYSDLTGDTVNLKERPFSILKMWEISKVAKGANEAFDL